MSLRCHPSRRLQLGSLYTGIAINSAVQTASVDTGCCNIASAVLFWPRCLQCRPGNMRWCRMCSCDRDAAGPCVCTVNSIAMSRRVVERCSTGSWFKDWSRRRYSARRPGAGLCREKGFDSNQITVHGAQITRSSTTLAAARLPSSRLVSVAGDLRQLQNTNAETAS